MLPKWRPFRRAKIICSPGRRFIANSASSATDYLAAQPSAASKGMYPPPPQFFDQKVMGNDPVGQNYWIVANGIRLNGDARVPPVFERPAALAGRPVPVAPRRAAGGRDGIAYCETTLESERNKIRFAGYNIQKSVELTVLPDVSAIISIRKICQENGYSVASVIPGGGALVGVLGLPDEGTEATAR